MVDLAPEKEAGQENKVQSMRILLVSDVHEAWDNLSAMKERIADKKFDCIFLSGD